jgi:hypothetical protein
MKPNSNDGRRSLRFVLGVFFLCAGSTQAGDDDGQSGDAVQLVISVHKQRFLQCEPVIVTVRVSNPTDQKKAVVLMRDPWIPRARFAIRDPGGSDRTRTLVAEAATPDPAKAELPSEQPSRITTHETYQTTVLWPKTEVVYREILHYTKHKGNWLLFDVSGNYTIHASLPPIPGLQENELKSNAVAIEVVEPAGADKEVLSLFRGNTPSRHALFMQGELSHELAVRERFRSLVAKHPESSYAPYARLAIGRSHLKMGQYDDAIRMLEELLKTAPDSPLAIEVRHDIARADYLKGVRLFQDLIGQYPNWVGSHRAERVLLHGVDP